MAVRTWPGLPYLVHKVHLCEFLQARGAGSEPRSNQALHHAIRLHFLLEHNSMSDKKLSLPNLALTICNAFFLARQCKVETLYFQFLSQFFKKLPSTVLWFFTVIDHRKICISNLKQTAFSVCRNCIASARLAAVSSHLSDGTDWESVLHRLALFICFVMKSVLAEQ